MKPLISVVTVCFNAVKDIEKTILSVINQTYENIEYIIIDGGSTDGTVDVIKKYADRITYWVSEPDKGIYDAMNKGIRVATGEWINFMNAGDEFYSSITLSDVSFDSNYLCIYGNALYYNDKEEWSVIAKDVNSIRNNMPNTHQAFFIQMKIVKQNLFDLTYRYAADYNMVYNIFCRYGCSVFMKLDTYICRYEAQRGMSMRYANDVFGEVIDIRKRVKGVKWYYDVLKFILKKVRYE